MYIMIHSPHNRKSSEILTIKTINENNPLSETWTNDILIVLNNIRINSILLSKYHKSHYIILQGQLRYFRIPIIILSAISSLFNLGLADYMTSQDISLLCAILSLVTGLIGSIELYLQIQRSLENSLIHSRDFYLLAVDIQKCLLLSNENRNGDAVTYLNYKFNDYTRLIETSNILNSDITDELTPIPVDVMLKMPYNERVRNNFIIDEQQYLDNYQTYEISMGINDVSNIFISYLKNNDSEKNSNFESPRLSKFTSLLHLTHPRRTSSDSYRSRQNSVNFNNNQFRKNSFTNNIRSIHTKLFSRLSSKNNDKNNDNNNDNNNSNDSNNFI